MIVVWRVTQRCNLSCPFCSYDRTLGGRRMDADAGAVAALGASLAEFQRRRGERVLVSWIGGEPFLWPHLREMTVRFTTEFGLRISATTNGTTLGSAALRAHLIEHYDELTVSVDSIGPAHETLRGWPGGFAVLKSGLSDLAARKRAMGRGPRLRVNTVLMRDNVAEFGPLCDELADWGVEEITFNQLGGRDRPEFFPAHRLSPRDVATLAELRPRLRVRMAARGVTLLGGDEYVRRIEASTMGERLPVHDCRAGERFLFVDETGRVAPCNYTVQALGIPLAELSGDDGMEFLSERFGAARRTCRPVTCDDCHSTQVWGKFAR
jgi:MoaA/NifB/PqqE/SkfB family radical SAM enzyme